MTGVRRKSNLAAESPPWEPVPSEAAAAAPAVSPPYSPRAPEPAAVAPTAAVEPLKQQRAATAAPARRRPARDRVEARGRTRARDAAYAWAAARARLTEWETELAAELRAALGRGTDPAMLATYLAEALERNGLDASVLPAGLPGEVTSTTAH